MGSWTSRSWCCSSVRTQIVWFRCMALLLKLVLRMYSQKLDTNADGMVTMEEWCSFMTGMKQQRGDPFLNSIIRFWENRTQEMLQAMEADKQLPRSVSEEQCTRVS